MPKTGAETFPDRNKTCEKHSNETTQMPPPQPKSKPKTAATATATKTTKTKTTTAEENKHTQTFLLHVHGSYLPSVQNLDSHFMASQDMLRHLHFPERPDP